MELFLKDIQELRFLQYSLLAGLLASISCGIVGSFVVVRRISYIAAGIAHCVLGGMGIARYLRVVWGWEWMTPMLGALISAVLASLLIGAVSMCSREREDTVISALWAVGMALGILFISQTPGYNEDLMGYLFGDILMVSTEDLYLILSLDLIVVLTVACFYNQLLAVCFDEEFARLRGIWVEFYYMLLLVLTAITVVLLVSVVGIILMLALLTLPVAIAGKFSRSLTGIIVLSIVFTAIFTSGGLALSYEPNLPAGALTIVLAGGAYALVSFIHLFRSR